ncbi:helix-turn-helix domain-containing protein [Anaerosinus massiliensis]|uniref:helix-turn-helix domain-containing protein n=1 Tax=Massilibacillus massiliensis TaxID=1806837 RepID=UPI000AB41F4F|nr:helix-turn-helix transcriptional regulator [Massilibacillus massiliensis]
MKQFGENLRRLREHRAITQDVLGKLLNVSQSTIAYYESGKKQPSLETLIVIADYFEVSIDSLFNRIHTAKSTYEISKNDLNLLHKINTLSNTDRKEIESYIHYKENNKNV